MATFPSKVNYATGDILTATNMNDVGGAINLLDGAQTSGAKNRVLNSNMNVWQRSTSISITASAPITYTADRWCTATAANQAITVSRQATSDTTNLPFIQYCMRYQRNSGQTGVAALSLWQSFETVNSVPLAGKTVTLSFYARAGANYSATSNQLGAILYGGTGTDQNLGSGYTGTVALLNQTSVLTTAWQRFTYTGTVTSAITELTILFSFTPTGAAGTNDYFEVTGVQLEAANSVSPYAPNGATYAAELAACQRYYYSAAAANNLAVGTGANYSTTNAYFTVALPVTMRINTATLVSSTGTDYYAFDRAGAADTFNSLNLAYIGPNAAILYNNSEISGTAGQAGTFRTNNASASIALNAEL